MQFESLEATCVKYLSDQAQHMDASGRLKLAEFADHLGLTSLLESTAEHLIQLPWHKNVVLISRLLKLSAYADIDVSNKLLHHPERGA